LLASVPGGAAGSKLAAIEGTVPNLASLPPGCAFAPRCPERMAVCDTALPALADLGDDRRVRCVLYEPGATVAHTSWRGTPAGGGGAS
jgi:oligopeptide/dipeptide ABC transporter ATP-binding protein